MNEAANNRLGFVGLGKMGGPIAGRLIDAGYELIICDANQDALAPLLEKGAVRADTPKAVADQAPVVLISLPTPDVVAMVGLGENGLAEGGAVRTVIDLSTTGPGVAKQLAQGLADRSIAVIDCPVSGGVAGATKGTLSLMVAGDKERVKQVKPILDHLGKQIYVGAEPGMAQTLKVINNLVSVTALVVTSEALVMGTKAGLDADIITEVINAGSGRSNASEVKIPNFVLSRTFDFGFSVGLSAKDVRLCMEEADSLGIPMPVAQSVRAFLNSAADKLGYQADMTEMIRVIEDQVGVEVRGKAAKQA
ncbi:NAD(P)-dependent oxidoreductase [Pollutimonas sp. M17]|uniref:NAD(P)-dependent oxidoreductase n=1 Tax=Pollutimonas sp. M17 TaxID=2962065 RepID=UPI0021F47025|nr:NAD(P)-dependent oxidoreductase [Pollutimonas sp. M17]UYO93194.1 NAD(P)-dependent oxidoreductase [Pollutimonas sp. M17]HWK72385.1 NAD(P)-dependent oxidoreductase [Burkholderiaceae bacterium]